MHLCVRADAQRKGVAPELPVTPHSCTASLQRAAPELPVTPHSCTASLVYSLSRELLQDYQSRLTATQQVY